LRRAVAAAFRRPDLKKKALTRRQRRWLARGNARPRGVKT